MTVEKLLRGTTHRFEAHFKDKVDGSYVEMSDSTVKAQFYENGEAKGSELSTTKSATGIYYVDRYFPDTTDELGIWKVNVVGDVDGSGEKKQASIRFKLVDSYN